eukprot:TRINITY_DN1104_c1_g2_i1.p1 TRINITY_DN1104_c1_g2~~TRINITY_DN1104_c1_g2_i1.p1  ORF type:complete len:627 (+),score=352.04 TRINITY_DN1104_c1_g2_i1:67-1947(+)
MASPLPNTETIDLSKNDPKEKIQMTPEEMHRFKECMKDPKFMDLWSDYAKEISDPKHLKEQEEYLKQIESEAKEQGDHSFTFIFPKPNFAVKSASTKERFFINICDEEKCDEPKEETTGDRMASQWMVPVSLGKLRDGDYHGKPCKVVDACYHPKATYLAKQSDKFMVFLVEIAIENVNFQYHKEKKELQHALPMEFSRVTDTPAVGHPTAQTIRVKAVKGKEGQLVVEKKKKEYESDPSSMGKGDDQFKLKLKAQMGDKHAKAELAKQKQAEREAAAAAEKKRQEEAAAAEKKRQEEAMKKVEEEKKRAKEFAKNLASGLGGKPASKPAAPAAKVAPAAKAVPASAAIGSATANAPAHTVTEVGEITYQDCLNETELAERKLPKSLKVQFALPDVARASEVDIDIEERAVVLSSDKHDFSKTVPLPYSVDTDHATAKFDKTKRVLTIGLPVVFKSSKFEIDYRREQAEKRAAFKEEAARQAEEERLEKEEEARLRREEKERELAEEKAREDADEKRRLEVEERLSKIAEDERIKQEKERREREAELEKRERERLQKKLEQLEATKDSMTAMEEEQRRTAEKEHDKLMRKIKKEMEAIKLAESMAAQSKKKQDELPFTNRYIFELE